MGASDIIYCRARVSEAKSIKQFIDSFSGKGLLASRTLDDIFSCIRDFFLAKADGKIIGCLSVHLHDDVFAEFRSFVVDTKYRGKGIGSRLVELALYDAKIMGAKKAFGFTRIPDFFAKFKFKKTKMSSLPPGKYCASDCIPIVADLDKIGYVIKYRKLR